MHYLTTRDPWRDSLLRVWNDYEAGLVSDWPEAYNNQIVEALHYLRAQIRECESRYIDEG